MIAPEPVLNVRTDFDEAAPAEFPCSQSQLRFWIEEQLSPRNPALNVAVRWRIDGLLSHTVLEEAWRRLVHRHDPLRTAFATVDDQPVQRVAARVAFSVPLIDLRSLPTTERTREADRLAEIEARTPFDIAVAPLIRATRLVLDDQTSIVLVTAHHAVCDGWSIGILAREMGQICSALSAGVAPFLPELGVRFGEFAQWERELAASGSLDEERAYVRELLRDSRQFEFLPDRPRPRRLTANGAIVSRLLDRALTDSLAALARRNGCTLFMTALAAMFALFHRYTGETDIVIGTQVVGRDDEELEKLVGCFINTIALRADLSGEPDFLTLLERTRDMVSDSFDVRALPLQQLVEIANPARDPSRNALFSVNVIFQRSFITNESYGSFALVDLPSRSAGALYDINLFMVERPEGWRVSCEYNTDLFDARTVDGLVERFRTLLESAVADPTQGVGRLDILGAADRHALVVTANQTHAEYPAHATLSRLIAQQVARTPDATAIVCGHASRTFVQLERDVKRLAQEIVRRGCAPGMRVGILLDRSPEMVVAMLAVLETGCAYVPLDPKYPAERIAFIAADAELALTITRPAFAAQFALEPQHRILVDEEFAPSGGEALAARAGSTSSTDVAYVIYTSGSTGKPKGVQIPQRALVNFLCAMRERPGLTARDTLLAVTTISFDIAGLELFLPLITGAKLVIARETEVVDGTALVQLMRRTQATIVQATPVTWQLLIDAGWRGDPAVTMLCGGEALTRPLAEELLDCGPELWNMYGPTETTIWSAAVRVERGTGPVPIGPPIANTQFYVVDTYGNLTPPGVPGELYIGGDGVARGYFKRPDLTRERFVPDTFGAVPGATLYRTGDIVRSRDGGTLEFLGRTDQQVKVRGFRIELEEIAAVLLRQPGVGDAVAITVEDTAGGAAIRAFVAPQPGFAPDVDAWPALLRAQIAEFLPNYMLPAVISVLDELPRTPNGKIHRAALPLALPESSSAAMISAPLTETEKAVRAMAAELLGHERFGSADDLFTLGFHSLLAVRLVARIGRELNATLPLRLVFDRPTVAGIAAEIDAAAATGIAVDVVPEPVTVYNAAGQETPFIFFHNDGAGEGLFCRRLAASIRPSLPVIAVAPHGSAGLPALSSIESMAAHYLELLRAYQPHGPYRLGGFCAGGLVAYELARLLRARGETVAPVLLVNASAPPRRAVLFGDWLVRRIGLDASLAPQVRANLCWTIVRLFDAIGGGPIATSRFVAGRFGAVRRRLTGTPDPRFNEPEPVDASPTDGETRSYFANLVAAYTFHPKPYDGEIVFAWGSDQPETAGGPTTGWNRVARNIRVVPIPGRHLSPVSEGVEDLGRLVAREFPA